MVAGRALLGEWRLTGASSTAGPGLFGTVHGTLTLVADGPLIRWCESGTLRWDDTDLPVTRELLLAEEPTGWQVRFADGRPFHPWRPARSSSIRATRTSIAASSTARPDRLRDAVGRDRAGARTSASSPEQDELHVRARPPA